MNKKRTVILAAACLSTVLGWTVKAEPSKTITVGDMVFDADQLKPNRSGSGFVYSSGQVWTEGKVPVKLPPVGGAVSQSMIDAFNAACLTWKNATNGAVQCVPYDPAVHVSYLIVNAPVNSVCQSAVGESSSGTGPRSMNLGTQGCWFSTGYILHELAHVFGFLHEQQRPDRDTYVKINYANINGSTLAFDIVSSMAPFTAYDFRSISHYPKYANSANSLPTIEAQPAYASEEPYMGVWSNGLSALDKSSMIALYTNHVTSVSVASPYGTTFSTGQPIKFSASTSVSSGAISKVEFFDGLTKIGEDMTAPFAMTTWNLSPGTHKIKVRAYDDQAYANSKWSSEITVTVTAATVSQQIVNGFYRYLPGCWTSAKQTYWENWFANGGTSADFTATLVSNSTPSTIASCSDWTLGSPRTNSITYMYNRYLPGCLTPTTLSFWEDWFTHPGALPQDFVATVKNLDTTTCAR